LRLRDASELSLGSAAIRQGLGAITSDIELLSALPRLRVTVQSPTPENLDRLADNLAAFMNANSVYDQIRWIDETGMERIRLNYDREAKQNCRASPAGTTLFRPTVSAQGQSTFHHSI
jgi:hypothetical protein